MSVVSHIRGHWFESSIAHRRKYNNINRKARRNDEPFVLSWGTNTDKWRLLVHPICTQNAPEIFMVSRISSLIFIWMNTTFHSILPRLILINFGHYHNPKMVNLFKHWNLQKCREFLYCRHWTVPHRLRGRQELGSSCMESHPLDINPFLLSTIWEDCPQFQVVFFVGLGVWTRCWRCNTYILPFYRSHRTCSSYPRWRTIWSRICPAGWNRPRHVTVRPQ